MQMSIFVWTKMQTEAGQSLPEIIARKECERLAGNGVFWWGIGNSLGTSVRACAEQAGGTLPVLFSIMKTQPKKHDVRPAEVYLWSAWEDDSGTVHELPSHVLVRSRGDIGKKSHYALVCRSAIPLAIGNHGPFNPVRCRTYLGNPLGASQVTALAKGNLDEGHMPGDYDMGFRATPPCQ